MKLSSKLLIGLGIALFVIPIPTFTYILGNDRVDAKVYEDILKVEGNNPNSDDTYLKTFKTKNFNELQITGNQHGSVKLYLVKSDQYAVKIDKNNADALNVRVSENGQLLIDFKEDKHSYFKRIYIFTPDVKLLKLSNVHVGEFVAKLDELEIVGEQVQDIHFSEETEINKLTLKLSKSAFGGNGQQRFLVNQLVVDLDSSDINLVKQNYDHVFVQAKDSKVNFSGENSEVKLKHLSVHTTGTTTIGLNDLVVDQIDGQLSDESKTDFPVYLLRKILK